MLLRIVSGWTTSFSTTPASRVSAKSSVTVASGPIARSTEECDMSRSCQSATFSSAGVTAERTSRASPVRFSVRTGLRLCGIAEDPFCPAEKNSSASRTSVRCMWRISVAMFSMELAITPSVAKNIACRSRGMTWVLIGSGRRPSFSQTCTSTAGSTLAKVPTAPDIAPVAISHRALSSRSRFRSISAKNRAKVRPIVVGSAWMPWLRPIRTVCLCSNARARARRGAGRDRPRGCRRRGSTGC